MIAVGSEPIGFKPDNTQCNSLSRVFSKPTRNSLLKVLKNPTAGHFERVWLVGFLKYVGYSFKDVLSIIHELRSWSDYNREITRTQASSVFHGCGCDHRPSRYTLNKASPRVHDEPSGVTIPDAIPDEPKCTADLMLADAKLIETIQDWHNHRELIKAFQIISLIDEIENAKDSHCGAGASNGNASPTNADSSRFCLSNTRKRGGRL